MIFDDGKKMINEINADIVDLVVPTVLHVPFAIRAAKAGKNIICEKPLTGYFGDPSVPLEEREMWVVLINSPCFRMLENLSRNG